MAQRPCSECGKALPEGSKAKTCSARCRKRRARRLAREDGWGESEKRHAQEIRKVDAVEVAKEVFKQELTPIVRSQITDEVVQSIAALMKLTPALVESLGNDLFSKDPNVRTRAQGIVAKYTLGQAEATRVDPKLVVNLGGMPDPSQAQPRAVAADTGIEAEYVNLRICERCDEEKPEAEFDGASPRCRRCQEEIRSGMEARFGA